MAMTAAERDFVATHLAESRDRLFQLVRGLSARQLDYRSTPERWSVAENIEHIILVERRACDRIEVALNQSPDQSRRSGYPGNDEGLIKMLRDRSHPRRGSEAVQPTGRWSHLQLFQEFEAVRKHSCAVLEASTADLHAHFSPHPLFGDLTCYQWFLVLSSHCDRHRVQSEELMAKEGFPPRAVAAT
jgi:hypothetical protein